MCIRDRILCGRQPLMDRYGVETKGHKASIFIAVDGKLEGMLQLADTVKPDSTEAVRRLKELGVKRVVMLTGDNEQSAAKAAEPVSYTHLDVYKRQAPDADGLCPGGNRRVQSPGTRDR